VAMFSREGSAVADDEVRRALDELAVLPDAVLGEEVEAHAHVNAAVAEMPVERGPILVFVQQPAEVAQIRAQLLRGHRRIVPPLPLERRAGRGRGGARPRLA